MGEVGVEGGPELELPVRRIRCPNEPRMSLGRGGGGGGGGGFFLLKH